MTHDARLIILQYTKIKDSAIVIHTLSREWGRRSFIVHLGKGASLALFQPLGIVEAEISENPKSELWRASRCTQAVPLVSLRTDPSKNAITLFLSEVLYRAVRDGMAEEGLYDWCERSILTLEALEKDYANFHLRALLELAAAMGFEPSLEDLAPFCGERYAEVKALLGASFEEAMLLPLSGERRGDLCEILIRYLSHHSESNLDIRSLRVLRELF